MTRPYTIFTGCSFSEGVGLPKVSQDKNLWVNIVYNSLDFLSNETNLLNLSMGGNSNPEIFQQSIDAISLYNCQYLFVCWTSLYRYKFSLGLELYDVFQYWSPSSELTDVSVNPEINYNADFLNNIKNRFLSMHHDHYEIVKILKYTTTISQICKKLKVKVYFVNNILPWDDRYFDKLDTSIISPSDTTPYTQSLLNLKTRNDDEFFEIYKIAHQEYKNTQGIDCNWLNLYSSFRQNFLIDLGNDNCHPGIKSNNKFADHIIHLLRKIT